MAKADISVVGSGIKIDLSDMWAVCGFCDELKPMRNFGMRRMGNGIIRREPRCKPCRKLVKSITRPL